jgi:flagellum-specific peptidoglycan hydrolase FlgJ
MGRTYRPAYAERGNWQLFAERLGPKTSATDTEHCGYSTNPRYSATLTQLITEFRLDDPKVLAGFDAGQAPEPVSQISA